MLVVAGLLLAMMNSLAVQAQKQAEVSTSEISKLLVSKVSESTDGNCNFRSFEVEAPEEGFYYTEFWLLPARYANNSFTTFEVFVNDDYVGSICPDHGNWQSARINGNEAIKYNKGANTITIAVPIPEFPEVEKVNVALSDEAAMFSKDAYEEYMECADIGAMCNIPINCEISSCDADFSDEAKVITDVQLNYTFYKTFNFTRNQQIFITSSSVAPHKLDMVYYGSIPLEFSIVNGIAETNSIVIDRPISKFHPQYERATSEEMQRLGWVFPSETAENSSIQVASAIMTIPKTGQYLIRVRHLDNGGISLADVNINGTYYYEDVPISLSYVRCDIPADRNEYATMTSSAKNKNIDPYLFIHGAGCDRIVGFNDDGDKEEIQYNSLSTFDSYISQKYKIKATGVSVSNYSSLSPKNYCKIIAGVSKGVVQSMSKSRAKDGDMEDTSTSSLAERPQSPEPCEPDGIIGGHEYVDLGLPSGTLWATYNLGATSPYEKGQFFAWGEVESKDDFSWENYRFFKGYDSNKGNTAILENIGDDISATEYDAARFQWGNGWRLPNEKEKYELLRYCWSNGLLTENGVNGVRIYGRNEHSIFLPVCGFGLWYGEVDPFNNTDGAYWTGVEDPDNTNAGIPVEPSNNARSMLVDLGGFTGATSRKAYGLNIRAVVNPKESGVDNVVSDNDKICLTCRNGYIYVTGTHSEGLITVYDLSGRIVFSDSVMEGTCRLPELAGGIYLVSYTCNGNTMTTQKITIK